MKVIPGVTGGLGGPLTEERERTESGGVGCEIESTCIACMPLLCLSLLEVQGRVTGRTQRPTHLQPGVGEQVKTAVALELRVRLKKGAHIALKVCLFDALGAGDILLHYKCLRGEEGRR